jgi:hypothetical protein
MCEWPDRAHSGAMAHITSPKSRRSVALAVSTLLSTLSLSTLSAPSAQAESSTFVKQTCASGVCLVDVKVVVDSDGDGVSDDDEVAAGTNPKDPYNRPSPKDVLGLAADGKLPSFNQHFTEVLVMPTEGPDGQAFGIADSFPDRDNIMGMFGIGKDLLNQAGLTANGGLRIGVDLNGFGGGSQQIGTGHVPVKVGGLDFGLISAGEKGGDERLFGLGENGNKKHSSPDQTIGNATTRNYDDGSSSVQVRHGKTGDSVQINISATGEVSPYEETSSSTSGPGVKTSTITTENAGGTQTKTEASGKAKDGTVWSVTDTSQTFPDGSGYGETTITETKNGKTTTTKVEYETACSGNTCTTTSTYDDGRTTVTTHTNNTPQPESGYSNPDADMNTIWVSEALFARVVEKVNDNKTPGPVQVGPSDLDPAVTIVSTDPGSGTVAGGFNPLVALVDDTADPGSLAPMVLVLDATGDPYIDKDPRLPNILDGLRPGGCLGCNA